MLTETEIKKQLEELTNRRKVIESSEVNNKLIPLAILDSFIYALKYALDDSTRGKFDYLFCNVCEILHKGDTCPNCGDNTPSDW